ncbi:MAG: phage minor head protein [Elusimicrobia bacterium]|nr:phage minor head protein [Elusimicrobiota bacterium]
MSANPKPETWPELEAVLSQWSSRRILTSAQFEALSAAAKARAGALSGIWETKFVSAIYDSLGRSMRDNLSSAEWLTGAQKILDAYGGGTKLGLYSGEKFSPWYAETIFRTNVTSALAAGKYADLFSPSGRRMAGFVMLSAIHDDRNEDEKGCPGTICRKLDGKVFQKDDPDVGQILTPLHFGCRCTVIELDDEDVAAGGYDVANGSDFADLLATEGVWNDDKLESLVDGPDAPMFGVDLGDSPAPALEGTDLDPIEDYAHAWEMEKLTQSIEHGTMIDVDGRELWTKTGNSHSIDITPYDDDVLKNGRLFVHNHPSGPSLSPDDLGVASRLNVQEIRAVGRVELANVPGLKVEAPGWTVVREYSLKPASWEEKVFEGRPSGRMPTSWGLSNELYRDAKESLFTQIAASRIFGNYGSRAAALAAGYTPAQIAAEWVEVSRRAWKEFAFAHPELVYSERVLGFIKGGKFYSMMPGLSGPAGSTTSKSPPPAWLLLLFS